MKLFHHHDNPVEFTNIHRFSKMINSTCDIIISTHSQQVFRKLEVIHEWHSELFWKF